MAKLLVTDSAKNFLQLAGKMYIKGFVVAGNFGNEEYMATNLAASGIGTYGRDFNYRISDTLHDVFKLQGNSFASVDKIGNALIPVPLTVIPFIGTPSELIHDELEEANMLGKDYFGILANHPEGTIISSSEDGLYLYSMNDEEKSAVRSKAQKIEPGEMLPPVSDEIHQLFRDSKILAWDLLSKYQELEIDTIPSGSVHHEAKTLPAKKGDSVVAEHPGTVVSTGKK